MKTFLVLAVSLLIFFSFFFVKSDVNTQSENTEDLARQAYYRGYFNRCIIDAEDKGIAARDVVALCTKILSLSVQAEVYENRDAAFPPFPSIPLRIKPTETSVPVGPQG